MGTSIHGNSSKSGNKTLSVSRAESVLCYFCGKNNHSNADCRTRTSEFTNNQNRPYVGSEAHERLVKAAGDRDWIPNFKELKWLFDLVNIMPSSSKSPQALSTKSHSFLQKSTDENPSKTTSTSVPSEVRTSQSTNSLNLDTTSLIILRRTMSSPMTIKPLKR